MARFSYLLVLFGLTTTLPCVVKCLHVSEGLTVQLKHGGSLIGRHMESANGRYILGFLGIPYAKPPLGDLRFRAPVPADSWEGVRMATSDGNICPQVDVFGATYAYSGNENCLYLNVYVPENPKTTEPLPVMVWIYGGGFVGGDGTSSSFSPKRLLDRDVIMVSMNYRLSTLGFLSSETLDMPGNYALKDQLMAIKWVKEHISSFGGDENNITIFGQSAGGASVTYQTLSEKSKGLFHKAIASSGTFYNGWAYTAPKGVAAGLARKLAKYVGCDVEQYSWAKTIQCLRSVSAKNLTEASVHMLVWHYVPMPPFPFVVEPEHEDAFITQLPQVTAHCNSIPMIVGFNKDEGMLFLLMHFAYYTDFEQFSKDLDTYFSYAITSTYLSKENEFLAKQAILKFYFGNGTVTKSQNLTDAFTDSNFMRGIDEFIRQRLSSQYPTAPTYVYRFHHKGEMSNSYTYNDEFQGVCHGDDNYYLFPTGDKAFPTSRASNRDREVAENMLDLWYNFAAVGNPGPANTYLPRWKAINSYPPRNLRIGSLNDDDLLLEISNDYPEDRANFWKDIKPYLEPLSQDTLQYAFL